MVVVMVVIMVVAMVADMVQVSENGARVVVSATTIETEGGEECPEQGCSDQCR